MTSAQPNPTPLPAQPRRSLAQRAADFAIDAFDPASWLGPIFQKEVRTAGRLSGTYTMRFVYLVLTLGIVTLVYFAYRPQTEVRGAAALQALQRIAPGITLAVLLIQAVVLFMMGPTLTSGSISEERRKRSLETLLTTPIRPWQVILGKLFGSLSSLLVLASLSIPLLLAVRIFGGVPAGVIFTMTALSLSTGLLGSALGLRCGMWSGKPSTASLLAMVSLIGLILAPLVVSWVWAILNIGLGARVGPNSILVNLSPLMGVIANSFELMGGPAFFNPLESTALGITYNLTWTALLVLWNSLGLRRLMRLEAAGLLKPLHTKPRRTRKSAARTSDPDEPASTLPTRQPRRVETGESREVGDDPVRWREFRQPLFARPRNLLFTSIAMVLLLGGLASLAFVTDGPTLGEIGVPFVCIAAFVFLMQAATLSGASVASEREARTWDVLLTTPLSAWAILQGKTLGSIRRLWFLPLIIMIALVLFGVATGEHNPVVLIMVPLALAGPAYFLCCSGTLASLLFKKASTAGVINVCVALGLWALLPILLGLTAAIAESQFQAQAISHVLEVAVTATNPMFHVGNALTGSHVSTNHTAVVYSLSSQMHDVNMLTYLGILAAQSAAYVVLGGVALGLAVKLFPRRAPRLS